MRQSRLPRELENYQREAEQAGWRLKPLRNGTLWLPPSGQGITTHHEHGTHDPRSIRNVMARLRRAGLTGAGKPSGRKPR